ncbi:hypothetical protein DXA57_13460 [Blautia sp. OF03-15BH]|nr:hypothetical protein DXA57_13460 [Blautia sp. OF03-15BH]
MVLATVVSWLFYIVSLQPPGCIVSILTENRKKASEKWKKTGLHLKKISGMNRKPKLVLC